MTGKILFSFLFFELTWINKKISRPNKNVQKYDQADQRNNYMEWLNIKNDVQSHKYSSSSNFQKRYIICFNPSTCLRNKPSILARIHCIGQPLNTDRNW